MEGRVGSVRGLVARGALLLAALGAACGGEGSDAPAAATEPTYQGQVAAILDAKCATCHVQGGIAPFPLTSYAEALPYKDLIAGAVSSRRMPPWPPASSCNEYKNDRSLSDEQIATIQRWVDAGAPEGSAAGARPGPGADPLRVDRVLGMAVPYTPRTEPDDYRCFLIDWPETEVKYVTGFRADPGEGRMVHHVITFVAPPEDVAGYQALDDADPDPGYTCFGGAGLQGKRPLWVGAWVPGSRGLLAPEGAGIKVQPGSRLILQVHYNLSSFKGPDQTTLSLQLADKVEKEAIFMPFADLQWVLNKKMPIPAGASDVVHQFSAPAGKVAAFLSNGAMTDDKPLTVHAAALHMHTRGRRGSVRVRRSSGDSACLLEIPEWNFHWQGVYFFQQPVQVAPDDQLSLECGFDNSPQNQPVTDGRREEPHDLNWGEGTGDEMCLGNVFVTQ